ncbi:MAG: L,D-transpeptidase [Pseudomonadota bacterium]|nr:L,D-transpeptidase [Pseudomonadota bacterium]
MQRARALTGIVFFVLAFLGGLPRIAEAGEIWLLVDTSEFRLQVMDGDRPVATFSDVAIGRNGVTAGKHAQDAKTPLGEFRVASLKPSQAFHFFVGLNYPNEAHARQAFDDFRLTPRQYHRIVTAIRKGQTPPQETPIGGYIGIHGVGEGDAQIHRRFNWTQGCVALTNSQIDILRSWIKLGTRVVIR